ncbi:MAG: alpha/beta hydrolase [Planctomycetota bacterium]
MPVFTLFLFLLLLLLPACASTQGPSMIPGEPALAGLERRSVTTFTQAGQRRTLSYVSTDPPVGTRVIFIHGTPGDAANFADYLQDPIPNTEAVAVDRIGFGHSSPGPGRFGALTGFTDHAESIAPLLVSPDGGPVILVGHSLGGPIACELAVRYPDRVAGLVVLAGSLDPDLERLYWYNYAGLIPGARWLVGRPILTANIEVFAAKREARALAERLDRITCPVTIIHGKRDELVPFANAGYLADRLSHAEHVRLVAIEDGHFLPWTRPGLIRREIEGLLP